jgi:hypothetical protein
MAVFLASDRLQHHQLNRQDCGGRSSQSGGLVEKDPAALRRGDRSTDIYTWDRSLKIAPDYRFK